MDENQQDNTEKHQTWWQKNKQPLMIIGVIILLLLITFSLTVYWFGWGWTGFDGGFSKITIHSPSKDIELPQAKTLWDWMQLLIIPLVLAIGGFVFSQVQKNNEQRTTAENQREVALQSYIDKISELLLHEHLGELKTEYEGTRIIARARTLAVLPQLDKDRKRSILLFLYESNLISKDKPIIDLSGADFSGIDLSGVNLKGVNLDKTNFREANLKGAWFYATRFDTANLSGADLSRGRLVGTHLFNAILININLNNTRIRDTNLGQTNLRGANLTKTELPRIYLGNADLYQADLRGANLKDATGITVEKLEKEVKSLKGAIMPDGSIHP